MAIEIESVLRGWSSVSGPFPPVPGSFTFKGDGIDSVTRTGAGVFRVVLSEAQSVSDGLILLTAMLGDDVQVPGDRAPTVACITVVSETEIDIYFVQMVDNTIPIDPQGFSVEFRQQNVEAVSRVVL